MQFPESWLREFCNPPLSSQELADQLTMSGLEVEELEPVAPPFTSIVSATSSRPSSTRTPTTCASARSMPASAEPAADRLRRAERPRRHQGAGWPLVGAELPPGEDGKPFKIGKGKLRGVESFGMLCSARELKLADDHGGLLELPADAPVGSRHPRRT